MKILIYSHAFHPCVGGSESACRVLADGLVAAGHEVQLVTPTRGVPDDGNPFVIFRAPSPLKLLRLVQWCDVYVHSNVSLRGAWPLIWHRKPWVVIHHSRITRTNGHMIWVDRLKRFFLRYATNISVSRSMAESLPVPSIVAGNGYDDAIFRFRPEIPRDCDVVFLGRLSWAKGAHVVTEAIRILKVRGRRVSLTIVGTGTESVNLHRQVEDTGLASQIVFAGKQEGRELGLLLNRHRVLVVPSLVAETFGLVIMEGLASGCGVIASDIGALKNTVGPCGLTFTPGDAKELADSIETMLGRPELYAEHQAMAEDHLRPFRRQNALKPYLTVLQHCMLGRSELAPAEALRPSTSF